MSTNVIPLFRSESLEARKLAWLGRPALGLGLPTKLVTIGAVLLTLAVVLLITFGSYARRVNLRGVVVPQSGLVKISAPTSGWIQSINVADGQNVAEGTVLYHVNVDTTTSNGDTQQTIIHALSNDRAGLNREIERKQHIRDEQDSTVRNKIENLNAQITQTGVQVTTQAAFEQKLQADLQRVLDLLARGLSTRNDTDARQQAWMAAKDRLEELKSTQIRLQAQLIDAKYQLATNDLQTGNDIDALKGKISEIDQQIANSEARHSIEIRAPAAGTVTAVIGHPGQPVTAGSAMLTIVPQNSRMQAELLAPSSAIGFIHGSERVLLRYSAFPYQKFGQYWGTVVDVSHASLPQQELNLLLENTSQKASGTLYRVIVEPDSQFVSVYGTQERVPASMIVEAFVLLDKRPLYQWIFEPLYGLRRNLQAN
jgi:membrane fusion protein